MASTKSRVICNVDVLGIVLPIEHLGLVGEVDVSTLLVPCFSLA